MTEFFAECGDVFLKVFEFLGKYWFVWAIIVAAWIIIRLLKEFK